MSKITELMKSEGLSYTQAVKRLESLSPSDATACSASFGERLTAAIAHRQTEIAEAPAIREAFETKGHPSQPQLVKEAVNSLTAGLGLCYLAGVTLEEMLLPWVASMEKRHPGLND